jgi:hypothetical protein
MVERTGQADPSLAVAGYVLAPAVIADVLRSVQQDLLVRLQVPFRVVEHSILLNHRCARSKYIKITNTIASRIDKTFM